MQKRTKIGTIYRIAMPVLWLGIVAFCIYKRDFFTVNGILKIAPQNLFTAFWVFMGLFAVKSISLVMYSGFLYAAIGLLFPLPFALLTTVCGSVIMFTIPYFAGRILGTRALNAVSKKYPKVALLQSLRGHSDYLSAMVVRLIGIIPYDVASIFLGAIGMKYLPYLAGSMCGYLPFMLILSFTGSNAREPGSPEFLISVVCVIVEIVVSTVACGVLWKKYRSRD